MKKTLRKSEISSGFSLAEVLAALTIGAMVLVSILSIYNRAESSAQAVRCRLDSSGLQNEVLQRIAEDLDRIVSTDSDTKITFENKIKNGYPAARMIITNNYKDSNNRERTFERITWISSFDYQSQVDGLVLYRSYDGIAMEDKVLDKNKYDWERELLVPICSGITYLKISAVKDKKTVEKWDSSPPDGITVTISFAEPFKKADGTMDVPEEEKFTRTIAIDRTRKINFYIEQGRPEGIEQNPVDASSIVEKFESKNEK